MTHWLVCWLAGLLACLLAGLPAGFLRFAGFKDLESSDISFLSSLTLLGFTDLGSQSFVRSLVYDPNGTHLVVKWVLARRPEDPFVTQTGPQQPQLLHKAQASSTAMHENDAPGSS